jgi:hypothetical protein
MSVTATPQLGAIIDFSDGATFVTTAFTLNDTTLGKLDTGQLATNADRIDVSDRTLQASIRRGRNRILDKFEAGTATLTLRDDNGDFNISNTSSPLYGKLVPLRKVQIFADYNGVRYPLFYGFITSYTTEFRVGVDDYSTVILQCVDGFRLLNGVGFSSVPLAVAGETTGSRLGVLLDLALWPASQRALDVGDTTCQADPGTANRNILNEIQLVGDKTEFGGIFCNNQGQIDFFSRTNLSARAAQPTTIFSDDGTQIGYQGIELVHDDVLIVNDVTVTALGGTPQQVTDATSISIYFTHSGVRSGIYVQSDAEAMNQAMMLLATRKDATLHISSLGLNLFDSTSGATARIVAGLTLDIFSPIQVTKTMPGATSITTTLFVQGVQHDVTKSSFITKLLTAEPIIKAFVLDDAQEGVLDGTAGLLSY